MANNENFLTPGLKSLKANLELREEQMLSAHATKSREAARRIAELRPDHRLAFGIDTDRILHSLAYTRYIDKTQVFYLVKNDHITHRVLHVQLVSRIARTIGRFLGLNEDLIEAIALGHDIGHPPFGHDGEKLLSDLCREHGLPAFQHNLQSIRFLDRLERHGRGWNLTLQTLDGILCHDGEIHDQALTPRTGKTFADFDREAGRKSLEPGLSLAPMTLEGCVVRFSDTISYVGRDIEDAIVLGLIRREEIPRRCREILGDTNGRIVYRLVTDLIANGIAAGGIFFSSGIAEALRDLKAFNYQRIYLSPRVKKDHGKIRGCYRALFADCLESLGTEKRGAAIFRDFLDDMDSGYSAAEAPAAIVRDFIAGMTDEYFVARAARLGCEVPVPREMV